MPVIWGRHHHPDSAVDRILTAAESLLVREGFEATTMAQVAAEAGCSRATLYNYFSNKRELRAALRDRAALGIAADTMDRVGDIDEPVSRLTEAMIYAIGRVRTTPELALWFTPENVGLTNELAHSSEVIDVVSTAFAGDLGHGDAALASLRARMIVRLIISFLSAPEAVASDERVLIERLVAPALAADRQSTPTRPAHGPRRRRVPSS